MFELPDVDGFVFAGEEATIGAESNRQDGSECAALSLLSRLFLKTYANLLQN